VSDASATQRSRRAAPSTAYARRAIAGFLLASCALSATLALGLPAVGGAAAPAPTGAPASAPEPPLLVVAGASGRLGQDVLRELPRGRFRVLALSSDPDRARRELPRALYARAQWRSVDVRDASQVQAALQGARFVISTIGARTFEGEFGPQALDYAGNVHLIDAARAAGVEHFVLVSSASAGAHRDQTQVPRMNHILLWKTLAEEHLKASGLAYTIVGPAGLMPTPARRERVTVIHRRDYVSTNVSRADVARIALDALTNPDADRKSFGLVGERRGDPEGWRAELRAFPRDDAPEMRRIESLAWLAGRWRSAAPAADAAAKMSAAPMSAVASNAVPINAVPINAVPINAVPINEESWLEPRAGLMLGMNREVRGSPARASFEFLRIEQRARGPLVYLASPGGRSPATEFVLTTLDPGAQRAVFTSLTNDFPKIITYWRDGDVLRARVDGVENGRRAEQAFAWR
jgi:uncharacterized protein YbjT (DUF2867 family)